MSEANPTDCQSASVPRLIAGLVHATVEGTHRSGKEYSLTIAESNS
jgi:hypothetical protein